MKRIVGIAVLLTGMNAFAATAESEILKQLIQDVRGTHQAVCELYIAPGEFNSLSARLNTQAVLKRLYLVQARVRQEYRKAPNEDLQRLLADLRSTEVVLQTRLSQLDSGPEVTISAPRTPPIYTATVIAARLLSGTEYCLANARPFGPKCRHQAHLENWDTPPSSDEVVVSGGANSTLLMNLDDFAFRVKDLSARVNENLVRHPQHADAIRAAYAELQGGRKDVEALLKTSADLAQTRYLSLERAYGEFLDLLVAINTPKSGGATKLPTPIDPVNAPVHPEIQRILTEQLGWPPRDKP